MSLKCLKRKITLVELISKGATGNAEVLAFKMNTSRRSIFRDIEELKDLSVDIVYCKKRESYVFNQEYKKQGIIELLLK